MTQVVRRHLLDWSKDYSTKLCLQPFARLIHIDRDTREPDQIALWFIVDNTLPARNLRTFHIVGTGWEIPNSVNCKHVGSVRMDQFMWHVFEEEP